jgi:aspartyl/asparaginyl beta-hydroxylase (cupin superfamily)
MSEEKLWFSYTLKPYELEEAGFFNKADFSWSNTLEANYSIFKAETEAFLKEERLTPYFNRSLSEKKNSWKTSGLLHWGLFVKDNYPYFCESWEVMKNIPGLVSFSVSWLKAGSKINEHNGDTNAIIRVHLPIQVPATAPSCSFTVNGETRSWEEGKVLLFNDAQLHSAQNLSDENRVVLIFDVIRPEFLEQKDQISARVLNGLIWQWMTKAYPGIRKYPLWFKKSMWSSIRFSLRQLLKFHRRFIWK